MYISFVIELLSIVSLNWMIWCIGTVKYGMLYFIVYDATGIEGIKNR